MNDAMLAMGVLAGLASGVTRAGGDLDSGRMYRLIDAGLNERLVSVVSITDRAITYEETPGLVRQEAITEFLALIPPAGVAPSAGAAPAGMAAPEPSMGWLLLDDGRRWIGALEAGGDGDGIRWRHPRFGVVSASLEHVRSIGLRAGAPDERGGGERDRVVLANGDGVEGFVESIAREGDAPGVVRIEGEAGGTREITLDRVRRIDLAGPDRPASGGVTAWLSDGSIVGAREVVLTRAGEAQVSVVAPEADAPEGSLGDARGAEAAGVMSADELVGVCFNEGEIVALASLEPTVQAPVEARRWTEALRHGRPGVLRCDDLTFPGPMRVEWPLPAGAVRVCGVVSLPAEMWTWGDCEVVVSAGGEEVWRRRVWVEEPEARFNVGVDGARRLEIRVEAGNYGSVQDRVVLTRAFVLVEAGR